MYERTINGLNDEVNVRRSMRPQAHVHLLGITQAQHGACCWTHKRTQFSGLGFIEVGNVNDMSIRLDDKLIQARVDPRSAQRANGRCGESDRQARGRRPLDKSYATQPSTSCIRTPCRPEHR